MSSIARSMADSIAARRRIAPASPFRSIGTRRPIFAISASTDAATGTSSRRCRSKPMRSMRASKARSTRSPRAATDAEPTVLPTTMIQRGRRDRVSDHVAGQHRLAEDQHRPTRQLTARVAAIRDVEPSETIDVPVDQRQSTPSLEPADRDQQVVEGGPAEGAVSARPGRTSRARPIRSSNDRAHARPRRDPSREDQFPSTTVDGREPVVVFPRDERANGEQATEPERLARATEPGPLGLDDRLLHRFHAEGDEPSLERDPQQHHVEQPRVSELLANPLHERLDSILRGAAGGGRQLRHPFREREGRGVPALLDAEAVGDDRGDAGARDAKLGIRAQRSRGLGRIDPEDESASP